MKQNTIFAVLAVTLLGLPLQIQATPLTVLNSSFEAPTDPNNQPQVIDNWTLGGTGGSGVWDVNHYPQGFWNVGAPSGDQVAYLSRAPHIGGLASISQILADNLAANTIYTLGGYVGHPIGFDTSDGTSTGTPTIWTASLYAGGNLLGSTSSTGLAGSFSLFSLVVDSSSFGAWVGLGLRIELASNQAQTAFDAITLDATESASAPGVPDGGLTILMLGMGLGSISLLRRKMS